MTQHTVSEAAKLVGKDRKTLYRDIKAGRLSATKNAAGMTQVETAELVRLYGALEVFGGDVRQHATVSMPQHETLNATAEIARLQAENGQLKERLADKDQHLSDMRAQVQRLEYKPKPWWPFGR